MSGHRQHRIEQVVAFTDTDHRVGGNLTNSGGGGQVVEHNSMEQIGAGNDAVGLLVSRFDQGGIHALLLQFHRRSVQITTARQDQAGLDIAAVDPGQDEFGEVLLALGFFQQLLAAGQAGIKVGSELAIAVVEVEEQGLGNQIA